MRTISEIEEELDVVRRIDERNIEEVEKSSRPLVESVFASSSTKRRRILERELTIAKSERAHEMFGLKLHTPQFSPGTIPLRVLARLSSLLNDAIEQTAWREWDVNGDSKNIDEGFRRLINLRLADIKSGSTELVLLGNTSPDLTGESALENGLRNIFEVFSAKNDEFPHVINGLGTSATKSIMKLMKTFESERIGVELSWHAPENNYHWDGRSDSITRIRALLEEFGEAETDTITIKGIVGGLSRRSVQIETHEGEKFTARYHRSLSEAVNSLHLDQRCFFTIEVTSYPGAHGIKRDAYRLMSIDIQQGTELSSFNKDA